MQYKINLAANVKLEMAKKNRTVAIANAIAYCCVGLLFISAAIVFMLKNYYAASDLKQQQQQLLSSIDSYHSTLVKTNLTEDRLVHINTILQKRSNYDVILSQLINAAPLDVTFTDMQVDKGKVLLTASSPTLSSLDTFLSSLTTYVEQKNKFADVTLSSLSLQTTGYVASVTITLL